MKIDVTEEYNIRLRDVFNGVLFETDEGEKLGVCMRDGGFEISVKDTSIKSMGGEEYYNTYSIMGGVIRRLDNQPCSDCSNTDPKGKDNNEC